MRRIDKTLILLLLGCGVAGGTAAAPAGGLVRAANGTPAAGMAAVAEEALNDDTEATPRNVPIDSVVVTGTRYASDIRHLPMSVSVIGRAEIDQRHEASLLPLLTEQVPGLFVTSRGVMGYGVSTGAAGGMSLRGLGGGATSQMLVLIDGQPQYMGIFGHPIADACQSCWPNGSRWCAARRRCSTARTPWAVWSTSSPASSVKRGSAPMST